MPPDLIAPEEVDDRMNWRPGRASRLARRGKLPHYQLPDGAVRFAWAELVALVRHVPLSHPERPTTAGVAHVV